MTQATDAFGEDEDTGRAGIYRFLSSVFLEAPTDAAVGMLHEPAFQDRLAELFGPDVVEPVRDPATHAEKSAIKQDFNDLFKVPLGKYLPPFESVHREVRDVAGTARQLLMGQTTLSVKRYYKAAAADLEAKELPDHIGVELAFLSYLCEREVSARAQGNEEEVGLFRNYQAAFFTDHLSQWLPGYCEKVSETCETTFYRVIAALAPAFIEAERPRMASIDAQARKEVVPESK